MYRIYCVYNGRKIYDVNLYTEREARREVREGNRDAAKNAGCVWYFMERA